ncbi:unnamed protein product [Symbiodinium sp. CCMP2456]|nr:unnamed protein product [Symbiodinium sp. CCMP2456]
MREVLTHHNSIPTEEEALLLEIADQKGVKDNEDGLEGWTAYQLLNKVSEGATRGFEVLTLAVEDIVASLSSKGSHKFRIRCSNVTQWRTEVQQWLQAQRDDVILVQETHLNRPSLQAAVATMHKAGYLMVGGEAMSTGKHGTKGGVAVLTRSHLQTKPAQLFVKEGCGFCAAEIRLKGVSILLLSLYLKNSTPVHYEPNAEILARLTALLKSYPGQWLVAGDFNVSPRELADTSLVCELGGQVITTGSPTTHGGTEIDFVIASNAIAGMVSVTLDWGAPHRPHASLCIEINMPGQLDKVLQLPNFPVCDAVRDGQLPTDLPAPPSIEVLGQDFSRDPMSVRFGAFSQWCQAAMYPEEKTLRGCSLGFCKRARKPSQPLRQYSTQAGLWLRVESWLNAVAKAGVRVSQQTCTKVLNQLKFEGDLAATQDEFRAELLAHFTEKSSLSATKEEFYRKLVAKAQCDHLEEEKARYQSWLEGATVKGMRPLYKAIRSHEQVLVRPFQDKEPALRPYLRLCQWEQIWQSRSVPVEDPLQELFDKAVAEARGLPPLTVEALRTRLQCLPEKAPGPDGWNNRMLKQLPPAGLQPLVNMLNDIEHSGQAPGQWRVVQFAMLPKKPEIERPIGLCHVVYKAWLQVRYSLVSAWLRKYERMAPWDAAKPDSTCLSVAVHRVFQSEIARATGQSRITCFLDLATFFETISHQRLARSAIELEYPATLLNIAIQVYKGARVITADSTQSPATYSPKGVIAGCPVAPTLSKLAIHEPCARLSASGLVSNLNTWLDDISLDVADSDADRAASRSVRAYRLIAESLGSEALVLSKAKSAFVCSDKAAEKRLRALLRPDDPPILSLIRDLGVDSAAARRRRVAGSNARLAKAQGRSGKLTRLKLHNKQKRAQIATTGVLTAATFGHQCQGFAPKRMKVLRAIAGGHYAKIPFGSLDLLFDMAEFGAGDPLPKLILEHWSMLKECVERNLPGASYVKRTWAVSWNKLVNSKQRWCAAAGPIASMQCYLLDMGFDASSMDVWERPGRVISLEWGTPNAGLRVAQQLREALLDDRWERISVQEQAKGVEKGIDWTVARKMLKNSDKKPLVASGLRMLWQGAVRRANHGGDQQCLKCGLPNTLRHVLIECVRWAEHDIGPDPAWDIDYPNPPPCFVVRGLVPKEATVHPPLTPEQLQVRCSGVFAGEFLPVSGLFYGTDASGGPKGEDARLRVVSWAVVAIRIKQDADPPYEVVGTMTGSLQIGATVNEGEAIALDQLAAMAPAQVNVAVDSKVAIRWCRASSGKQPKPGIWTTSAEERDKLQLNWTKGHMSRQDHANRFGQQAVWAWFANEEADRLSGLRSEEVFSYEQAARTAAIDRATRGRCAWLGRRCSHILQHDPVPTRKEVKFEAIPVKSRQTRKLDFNKRHALHAATQQRDPEIGHNWVLTSSAKNLIIKCQECGLYAQQTDPGDIIKFVLQHPCRGREATPAADSGIHSTHCIVNQGRMWQCSTCNVLESGSVLPTGKGKGKKGGKSKRPEEERQHAREVNAVRASDGKSSKSVASVSRSKARSQAYHASMPQAVPAASLGNPAVLPPAPPKAPPRQPVLLTEGPGAGHTGGAKGEVLPLSSKERLQAIFAKAKVPVLTQHDKAELEEADSSTPPRAHEGGGLPTLHGKRVVQGVARNNLLALPKTLGFEWCQGGPSGALLEFLGKGQDRVAYTSQDLVLKLSEQPQKQELVFANLLPGIATPVFWVEDVEVVLHGDKGGEQRLPMTLLCQKPVVLAAEVMEQRGVTFSFKFMCHVGCILTWLWTQNLHLLDLGESNMGMEVASTAEPYPALRYFDLLSWRRQAKPEAKWHGFHKLAQKMCPMHANWIRTVCSEVTQDAPKVFRRLASECQGYVDRLQQAGVMVDGEISTRQIFGNRG